MFLQTASEGSGSVLHNIFTSLIVATKKAKVAETVYEYGTEKYDKGEAYLMSSR